ncbi:MAG: CHAT domain-containing protein [Cytophagales bacterium]|nr:MAG: CHAT domain-containing protein [Cytophagales bacterium]TAF61908.1 MAG: CHAT domain-containing protein [Cytophagales bacterium]
MRCYSSKYSRPFYALFALFVLFFHIQTASAQTWKALRDSAHLNYDLKEHVVAFNQGYKAIEMARNQLKKPDTAYNALYSMMIQVCSKGKLHKEGLMLAEQELGYQEALKAPELQQAVPLLHVAIFAEKLDSLQKALEVSLKAASSIKELSGEKNALYLLCIKTLANVYNKQGRFLDASPYLARLVALNRELVGNDDARYIAAEHDLANNFKRLGRFSQATALYKNVLEYWEEHDIIRLIKNGKAEGTAFGQTNEEIQYFATLNNFADLYQEMADYANADTLFQRNVRERKLVYGVNSVEYAAALNSSAMLDYEIGDYTLALPLCHQATDIFKRVLGSEHVRYANSLFNLAIIDAAMNKTSEAEAQLLEVKSIYERKLGTEHIEYANVLSELGALYQRKNNYVTAELFYQQATTIYEQTVGNVHAKYADAIKSLAKIYIRSKNYIQAEGLLQQALSIELKVYGNNHPNVAETNYELAELYFSKGDNKKAEDTYNKAMRIYTQVKLANSVSKARVNMGLAKLNWANNNLKKAERLFNESNQDYLIQIREYFSLFTEKEKELFYGTLKANFEQYNAFAVSYMKEDPNVLSSIYNYQLATKALLFYSNNRVRESIKNSSDPKLHELFMRWESIKSQLADYSKLSTDELKKRGVRIEGLQFSADSLEKALTIYSSRFAKEGNNQQIVSWSNVRAKLAPDEAAIEIIRFRYFEPNENLGFTDKIYYVALVITPQTLQHPAVVVLENGAELETSLASFYRNSIKFEMEDLISYDNFWKPIQELPELQNVKRIFFSPDGVYNQINLNTLLNPETQLSVIDQVEIRMLSNTRELVDPNINPTNSGTIALLGYPDYAYHPMLIKKLADNKALENTTAKNKTVKNTKQVTSTEKKKKRALEGLSAAELSKYGGTIVELPGTKEEVENIGKICSENNIRPVMLLEELATEDTIKALKKPKILHIATHGFFDPSEADSRNPLLRSGLLLTGAAHTIMQTPNLSSDNKKLEDGVLTAYEVLNLDLRGTELVTMSACETGLGEVQNGEGVYGLQRAFRTAGAKCVIMSLWQVDDQTTQMLMSEFYRAYLGDKKPLREAFNHAQQHVRTKFAHPFYWGAFVMTGD